MVKKGFTLMEMMVVLTILAIFFAAASKGIAGKAKKRQQFNQHGSYTCILQEHEAVPSILQTLSRDNIQSQLGLVDSSCRFQPPPSVPFFNVNIIDWKSGVISTVEPQIALPLTISFPSDDLDNKIKIENSDGVSKTYALSVDRTSLDDFAEYLRVHHPNSAFLSEEDEDRDDDHYGFDVQGRGVFITW